MSEPTHPYTPAADPGPPAPRPDLTADAAPGPDTVPSPRPAAPGDSSLADAVEARLLRLAGWGPADTQAPGGGPEPPPGYTIERELARGGMGVVYLARQDALNRPVALKMVLGAGRVSALELARFLAEAETAAAIDHPHVVRVYDFGQHAGRPYLALEYLPRGTLAEPLRAGRLPARAAAELVGRIARGVAAAHSQGIVHRDLKPGNILFDDRGEPKVADFGLAKRRQSDLTQTQAVMGTPAYMAPEQAGGRAKFAGPQADVWALGVILYECLAGTRPFTGEGTNELLAQILTADPEPLRAAAPDVPRDLELICRKCLAKDPAGRYPTAHELAEDLARFATGEPVSVRPPSLAGVLRLWAGQNFGSAGWTVAGGVAGGVIAGGYAALELVGTKLYRAAAAYEQLPHAPKPLLPVGAVPEPVLVAAEVAMYLLLPAVLLATTLLVRPRNRSADVAAGLMTGLTTAVTFFTVAFGWWAVYSEAVVPAAADLALLPGGDAEVLERYPDLAAVPPADRRAVLVDKAQYDLAMSIPRGVLLGMFLSVALTVPASVALVGCAGALLRRDPRARVIVPLYFELTLPGLVFTGYLFLLGQRVLLYGAAPQYPLCYAGLLGLCGLAAAAAARRAPWPVRAVLQVAWVGFYAVTNAFTCYEF